VEKGHYPLLGIMAFFVFALSHRSWRGCDSRFGFPRRKKMMPFITT